MDNVNAGILSVQFRAKLGNKKYNLEKVKSLIEQHCDRQIDLILLPEFFSTGMHHPSFTEAPENENGGGTIKYIAQLAKRFNTNIIAGSVIEKDGDKLYNTSFVLNRKGEIIDKYRKIHLFNHLGGNEGERITAGNTHKVVDLDFAKVGLSLCFDIRYPLHYRELLQRGAEIMVCPTAWGYPNALLQYEINAIKNIWLSLNVARAVENLVYFVSSDLCGKSDSFLSVSGNSMITSPMGVVLQNAQDEETAIFAEIDLGVVRDFQETYPVAQID